MRARQAEIEHRGIRLHRVATRTQQAHGREQAGNRPVASVIHPNTPQVIERIGKRNCQGAVEAADFCDGAIWRTNGVIRVGIQT